MRLVAAREGRSGFSYHAWQVASGYVAAALSGASPPIFFFPSARADTSGHICDTGVLAMRAPSAATPRRTATGGFAATQQAK